MRSPSLESIGLDVRYALRTLRRSPTFTITAAATLALAIGGSTVMFSVVNAVLLRPLPYRSPEQLVMVWTEIPGRNLQSRSAYLTVEEWRRHSTSFADIAVFDPVSAMLAHSDGTERISVARISPNLLSLLGVRPVQGRSFSVEDAEQRQRLALISHRFWHTRFGGSTDAIGASIELDGRRSQIVGILPADFQFVDAEVWEPHTLFPDWEARRSVRGAGSWFVVGRLRPDVTVAHAQSEMSAIARALDDQLPAADRSRGISVIPLSVHLVGSKSRLALWLLTGAVMCVLLIAAANVTSLTLARSAGRGREIAVRAALGAGPVRIMRQLLAESLTLAAISGALGSVLAVAAIRLTRVFGPADLARLNEASLDLRALGWVLAISLLTGILVGVAPAVTMLRQNLRHSAERGRSAGGPAIRRIRRALVVADFALAMTLMAGASRWRRILLGSKPSWFEPSMIH